MPDYTILYIDEDPTDTHQFQRSFAEEFKVDTVSFEDINLESLSARLEEKDFDYLVVDYHLNEKSGCGFDGDTVVIDFVSKFPHFPTMLLTNHDEMAIESIEGFDVEKIHSKKEYTDENLKEAFIKRVKAKIDHYKEEISSAQEQIQSLIEKRQSDEPLTANEEEELIRLDSFLDSVLGDDSPNLSDDIKASTNTNRLDELLRKTDDLIEKLTAYENIQE